MTHRGLILALGGGGARGLAHLGVLEVLSRAGVPLAGLVGTSMGAIVAALYASGSDLERLVALATNFPWENLIDLRLPRMGLLGGDRLEGALGLLTKGKSFAELDLPVWVVATDLMEGSAVVLREGPLAPALRASAAVPGFFAPVCLNGLTLADGGVVAGVPVEIAREMGHPVVAVDVGFDREVGAVRGLLGVLTRVTNIMGNELDRRQVEQADLVIRPEVGRVPSGGFDRAEECIEAGRSAAREALSRLWVLAEDRKLRAVEA